MTDGRRIAEELIAESNPDLIPRGHAVRGISTYVDSDGNVRGQWVKTRREVDPVELVQLLRDEVAGWKPSHVKSTKPPAAAHEHLMAVYPMGDPHLGMRAWCEETGANFDLEIAEHNLITAIRHLTFIAPPAKRAVIVNLGDFLHADDQSNKTPQSGHSLDVDGRHARVMRVGIRTLVACVHAALARHTEVEVYNLPGNHDPTMALAMALMLEHHFHAEPRVTVSTSPEHYQRVRFGRCLIGLTHGDGAKMADLPAIMACDWAEDWGEVTHRHWYTGHVHHDQVKEYRGCTVESVRTLAAGDAWHRKQGYRAGRSMDVDVWHERRGRIMRHRVGVEDVEAADE